MVKILETAPLKSWIAAHKLRTGRINETALNTYIDAASLDSTVVLPPPPPPPEVIVPRGPPNPENLKLVFNPDFTKPLDPAVWGLNWLGSPGAITKPINDKENCAYDPSCVSLRDGMLVLSAKPGPVVAADGKTYAYRSGMIQTGYKKDWQYGVFEARIWGDGSNWPAFWLNGYHSTVAPGKWPSAAENDIFENNMGWHYHALKDGVDINVGSGKRTSVVGWHTFTGEWSPGLCQYWYDGVDAGSIDHDVKDYNQYLILNHGISPTEGGPVKVPAEMLVSHVRVFQRP